MIYSIKRWAGISCILLAGFACSSEPIEIEGFNGYVWKQDKWGCGNERQALLSPLLQGKEAVMGHREPEVFRLLGKPDEIELYTRNQKFLIYYLEPSTHCTSPEGENKANANALYLRLNAMGMAQEMFVKKR